MGCSSRRSKPVNSDSEARQAASRRWRTLQRMASRFGLSLSRRNARLAFFNAMDAQATVRNSGIVLRQLLLMNTIRARKLRSLKYGDPRGFLIELRKAETALRDVSMPDKLRRLRSNALKQEREMRDAALFCVGIGERIGVQVRLSPTEDEDFDFVTTWEANDTQHICTVQLKEVAPEDLNPKSSIADALNSLKNRPDARDLTVAIRLSRTTSFDPASLVVPINFPFGGLWVFGCVSEDQSKWAIWGDFMGANVTPIGTVFEYPTVVPFQT